MSMSRHPWRAVSVGLLTMAGAVLVALNPGLSLQASLAGLQLWFTVVLPSLFPFFVLTELLLAYGIIDLLGVLLDPVMRSVFRLPGEGGFALAISLMSGTPVGARVVSGLREDQLCTREEGERMVALANTASPLFIVGAIAAGMFQRPDVGAALAVSHYVGAIAVGVMMRFYNRPAPSHAKADVGQTRIMAVYFRRLHGRSWGAVFADAVRTAMQAQLLIGGTMMFFSVVATLLASTHITDVLAAPLIYVGQKLHLSEALFPALITGIMEVTLGMKQVADAASPLTEQLVAASIILGWSGFSIHAQVFAMIQNTDLRYTPYVVGRLIHGPVAAATMWLLAPRFTATITSEVWTGPVVVRWGWAVIRFALLPAILMVVLLLITAMAIRLSRRLSKTMFRG